MAFVDATSAEWMDSDDLASFKGTNTSGDRMKMIATVLEDTSSIQSAPITQLQLSKHEGGIDAYLRGARYIIGGA